MAQLDRSLFTGELTLRRFRADDLDDLSLLYANESVVRYLYRGVRDREQTRAALNEKIRFPTEVLSENTLPVAVMHTSSERLIGDFMLHWRQDENLQGEVGGTLLPAFQGRGYAVLIYRQLLAIGFDQYKLHRIVGRCDARNTASLRSLEKAGLHREAHLIENEFVKGEWTDEVVMAIRTGQWRDAIAS